MYIGYKNSKLKKICKDLKSATKVLPQNIKSDRLFVRMRDLAGFDTMADIPADPPFRLHRWLGKRQSQWTIDIQGLYRIHFVPTGEFDSDENGNPILATVSEIIIVDIGDFHDW
ncbi:MAG: hypothetical protein HN590_12000 [Calditrichaeota bacterium]|nr:hypothetical protein [Calditrichota bacterium]MBT7789285.1 hypothetical protein [Calditrichota bacterium]